MTGPQGGPGPSWPGDESRQGWYPPLGPSYGQGSPSPDPHGQGYGPADPNPSGGGFPPSGQYPGQPTGFPAPPPPWGAPPPPRRRRWLPWVIGAAVLAVVLLVAVVVVGVQVQSREVTGIDDATVGTCVSVRGSGDEVSPRKIDCSAQSVNFYIAQTVGENARCSDDNALSLTDRGEGTICLTPNLRQGKCYKLPGTGGSIVDLVESDCATPSSGSGPLIQVVQRLESAAADVCTAGEALSFRLPTPVTYCADVVTPG